MWISAAEPVILPVMAPIAPPQAAAEYVAIVAQSAATRAQILMGQASRWVGDHPALVWGGVALFVLLLWATRSRAR